MERTTHWETAALRGAGRRSTRPTPGSHESTVDLRTEVSPSPNHETTEGEPDTLLVPLSAWNKMLDQLGNLHEAGRELAEARERAARAETEAAFLRQRLAELRGASATAPEAGSAADPESAEPGLIPPDGRARRARAYLISSYGSWRNRHR